jgi:hypothetical protein
LRLHDSPTNVMEPLLKSASSVQLGYFDLQALSKYCCCSVRWLRDRLVDTMCPLPHHRIGGKILIRKDDFDRWMQNFQSATSPAVLDNVVDDVLKGLVAKRPRQSERSR